MTVYHGGTDEIQLPSVSVGRDGLAFEHYDKAWLDFIAESRKEMRPWQDYDLIEGGVANDRVVDTVEAYIAGLISVELALSQLSYHKPNNQFCLLSQELTNRCLKFQRFIKF